MAAFTPRDHWWGSGMEETAPGRPQAGAGEKGVRPGLSFTAPRAIRQEQRSRSLSLSLKSMSSVWMLIWPCAGPFLPPSSDSGGHGASALSSARLWGFLVEAGTPRCPEITVVQSLYLQCNCFQKGNSETQFTPSHGGRLPQAFCAPSRDAFSSNEPEAEILLAGRSFRRKEGHVDGTHTLEFRNGRPLWDGSCLVGKSGHSFFFLEMGMSSAYILHRIPEFGPKLEARLLI